MIVIAHAGDWITSLIYLAPVAIVLGVLVVNAIRDRRRGGASREPTDIEQGSEP